MIKPIGRLCKWKMQGVSPRADRCAELMSRGLKEGVCVHACVHSCMCVHSNLDRQNKDWVTNIVLSFASYLLT